MRPPPTFRGLSKWTRVDVLHGQATLAAMYQVVQVVGALLILAAYAAAQFGALNQRSRVYLVLNLIGSALLTLLAWREEQWGFLLLEGVWALVSLWGLVQVQRADTGRPRCIRNSPSTASSMEPSERTPGSRSVAVREYPAPRVLGAPDAGAESLELDDLAVVDE
jgi:hypothetical protein